MINEVDEGLPRTKTNEADITSREECVQKKEKRSLTRSSCSCKNQQESLICKCSLFGAFIRRELLYIQTSTFFFFLALFVIVGK